MFTGFDLPPRQHDGIGRRVRLRSKLLCALHRSISYLRSGLLAPARTPEAVIDKLNAAVNEGLRSPDMQASIAKLGLETQGLTAREFAAKLDEEARNWEAAVNESGVKLD
jgi:tripartite-type tricarboxylate transporter receptor subunit TctC